MADGPEAEAAEPRGDIVRRIRTLLGRPRKELAAALRTSPKAIQSYEQGWRRVPFRTLIQLLVLLDLSERNTRAEGLPG